MIHRDTNFSDEVISIDGNSFFNCEFKNCTLIYSALLPVSFSTNRFSECKWVFSGAAETTLGFLYALYHGGMKEIVEETMRNIMANRMPTG